MRKRLLGLLTAFALIAGVTPAVTTAALAGGKTGPKPTIVFVHGAFADASGFGDSIAALQRLGYPVYAPPNPLRSLTGDAESLRTFLSTLTGPIVLVGHSYGGAVITNAATGNPHVRSLVYIAAYALQEGESVADANALGGGHSSLLENIDLKPYPGAPPVPQSPTGLDMDAYIRQDAFRQVFAADVPPAQAAVLAAGQRPGTLVSLGTPSGPPAWRTIPSWYLVAGNDRTIPPEAERFMAARAKARTVEIASSHAAMVSHPREVTALILAAAR
ncbi:alpha/beta fold hydrolase [Actinoplanes sp. RD1]|uniref:alpha/beta fold hydrolase n=1 Tax=Actinoplanes sp. RD1 TaxID=3064538 RepID=UPI002741337C|nr:alpha/beta hydrolase [Actinoplanes sp. RD1]